MTDERKDQEPNDEPLSSSSRKQDKFIFVVDKILSKLKRLSSKLGKVPTLLYILLYLILIFVSSGVYYSLPSRSFYHSTSQYEYDFLNSDANELLEKLRQEILSTFNQSYNQSVVTFDGWQVNAQEVSISSLNVKDFPEDIKFKIRTPITYDTEDGKYIWSTLSATISVPLREKTMVGERVYFFIQIDEPPSIHIDKVPDQPKVGILFPFRKNGAGFSLQVPTLAINISLYQAIIDFGQGYRGFPSNVSGQYWRMLYFSAGVATSNALGDIAPITTRARLLVTTEAIISLILVGLFLNALGYDVAEALGKYLKALDSEEQEK